MLVVVVNLNNILRCLIVVVATTDKTSIFFLQPVKFLSTLFCARDVNSLSHFAFMEKGLAFVSHFHFIHLQLSSPFSFYSLLIPGFVLV